MLPTFIRSVLEFQAAVRLGSTSESLVLEFKTEINGWNAPKKEPREQAQKEICRDIAQFANTLGGCLLIGITTRFDQACEVNVADAVVPVKEVEKLWQWIDQAIVNCLVPATFTHDVVVIALPQGNILAVNVPASRHLISVWDRERHTIECVRRTSYGKAWMNPDEMERHLMDGSRAAKLAFLAAKTQATCDHVDIVGGLWIRYETSRERDQRWKPPNPITIGQIEEYWFELCLLDRQLCSVTIPYGLIKESWVGASGAVTLLLAVRIIQQGQSLTLEPYT